MAVFTIHASDPKTGVVQEIFYDNMNSTLKYADGSDVCFNNRSAVKFHEAPVTSKLTPLAKSKSPKVLKVSLGLSCNYECSYCSQRFVPHGDSTTQHDIPAFVEMLTRNLESAPEKIEYWGGEPFVYWKTLKPLAELLREKYPNATFSMITNGSLLDEEKNIWLDNLGFSVGLSHDGPGYHARGLDPLDNPEQKKWIMDLAHRLGPKGRMSINAMMHKDNTSRAEVQQWIQNVFGKDVPIGEGAFIDPYDEGGMAATFTDQHDHIKYRLNAFSDIRSEKAWNFAIVTQKIQDLVDSVQMGRPAISVGQKCGMDRSDNLAVDMNGNVLTCQNTSHASLAPNGESHKIGHIDNLDQVKLTTSTHWSQRENCSNCPVVQICKGACMYLEGPLWTRACDSSYSDNIPFFAAAIEMMTGGLTPIYIDGPLPESRKDLFGFINGIPEKKSFPIPVVSA